jgi:hypothetical protein
MAMRGMGGPAAGSNPAIALVLALFMLSYILWTIDRLAALPRASAGTGGQACSGAVQLAATAKPLAASSTLTSPVAAPGVTAAGPALAPRFAACCKIGMSAAMGYMLIMML